MCVLNLCHFYFYTSLYLLLFCMVCSACVSVCVSGITKIATGFLKLVFLELKYLYLSLSSLPG